LRRRADHGCRLNGLRPRPRAPFPPARRPAPRGGRRRERHPPPRKRARRDLPPGLRQRSSSTPPRGRWWWPSACSPVRFRRCVPPGSTPWSRSETT